VALDNIADWLGELAFTKCISSSKVLNTIALLANSDEEEVYRSAKRIAKY
jgi:hypothetical protein